MMTQSSRGAIPQPPFSGSWHGWQLFVLHAKTKSERDVSAAISCCEQSHTSSCVVTPPPPPPAVKVLVRVGGVGEGE